jgi:undecaprenol kinase
MITSETGSKIPQIQGIQVDIDAEADESMATLKQKEAYRSQTTYSWRRKTGNSAHMIESFFHAFHGIWVGFKEERNLRIHFLAAVVVVGLGMWLHLDMPSWTALVLAMGLVLVTEFVNTAIEHLVDLASEGRYHQSARYSKDTAAAAVLCASAAAAVIGGIVFWPYLVPILKRF